MTQVPNFANISDEEFFRINRTLPPERIEPLLDAAAYAREVKNTVEVKLEEAECSIPGESEITEAFETLLNLARALPAHSMMKFVSAIEEAQRSLVYSCEYAYSEIKDARDALKV